MGNLIELINRHIHEMLQIRLGSRTELVCLCMHIGCNITIWIAESLRLAGRQTLSNHYATDATFTLNVAWIDLTDLAKTRTPISTIRGWLVRWTGIMRDGDKFTNTYWSFTSIHRSLSIPSAYVLLQPVPSYPDQHHNSDDIIHILVLISLESSQLEEALNGEMRLILLQNIDKHKSSLILLSYKRAIQKRTQGIADVLANKGALEIDAEQTTDHRRRSPWGYMKHSIAMELSLHVPKGHVFKIHLLSFLVVMVHSASRLGIQFSCIDLCRRFLQSYVDDNISISVIYRSISSTDQPNLDPITNDCFAGAHRASLSSSLK
ncbi:hypothetical protein T03_13739 [Trichinella britovi]|uniref:Uncharacterized protein n=1 Tax=Trichinella britovi TaxID=45882 RepID=A0A0V1DA85_TRIBR|nr:hypothetical protein T03_13739 [Trichinella britovi]